VSHTAGNLVLHLIFSTKDRQPLITTEIRTDLFAYLGAIIHEMRGTALIVNGTRSRPHADPLRPAQAAAKIARVGQNQFLALGPREMERAVCLGRRDMVLLASANPTCLPFPGTSRHRRSTTRS
jgi:hypothetical protein